MTVSQSAPIWYLKQRFSGILAVDAGTVTSPMTSVATLQGPAISTLYPNTTPSSGSGVGRGRGLSGLCERIGDQAAPVRLSGLQRGTAVAYSGTVHLFRGGTYATWFEPPFPLFGLR